MPRFNPRSGDRRGQRPLSTRPSSSLWIGLGFLLLLGLAQMYYLAPGGRTIPYSDFKTLIRDGKVAEVTVGEQIIRGRILDDAAEIHHRHPVGDLLHHGEVVGDEQIG